jgi:sigma-B regulation protein RsbU (phosphoserine phosphatase)
VSSPAAASEAFYAALLQDDPEQLYERAPCGYLSTTPDGIVVKANATFLDLTGYDREDLVGRRTFAELLTAGGRIYHETHYAPMLRMQGAVREVALEIVRADGDRLPVLVNAALVSDDHGEPRAVRIAVFDATHRREYERELLRAKQRAEQSESRARALAQTLQSTLIPPSPPLLPGLEVSAAYRPAGDGQEVGGDFYDIFQISAGDWVVALGDVCGKGVEAAVVTALVRYTIRALTVQQRSPSRVLGDLNDVLLRHDSARFCTVVLVRLHQEGGAWSATLASGGHPLPLHLTGDRGVEQVGAPGTLVGVLPEVGFTDTVLRLPAGDLLVVYTDGVTEGRRGKELFGEDRLHRSVLTHRDDPMPADGILGDVLDYQEGSARDDIAVVTVRVPSQQVPSEQQVREELPT